MKLGREKMARLRAINRNFSENAINQSDPILMGRSAPFVAFFKTKLCEHGLELFAR